MWKKVLAGAVLAALVGAASAAGVRVKTVDAEGVGATREDAVKAALAEAVARVSGLELAASDQVRAVMNTEAKATDNSATVKMTTEDKLQHEVSTATQGTVRGYQVVSVEPDSTGKLLRAKLSVDVNYFQPGDETNRMRIAVVPFELHHTDKANAEGLKFLETLGYGAVNYLTGTRRFAMLDRDFENTRLSDLAKLSRPDVRLEERARLGNTLGADYIVVGRLMELQASTDTKKMPYTNEVRQVKTARIAIEWRVIEASTGQIVMADTLEKVVQNVPSFGKIASELGREIGVTVADAIYPIAALSYQRGELVLGQGGNSMRVGDVYKLVRNGAIQVDPYTKETIGRDEIDVGEVRITRVTPKMSYAKVIECTDDLTGMAPREYILRPTEKKASAARAAARPANQPAW